MSVLSALKPESVFSYFEKLCSVPHGSGNTKIISDLCAGFAQELGLRYRQDELNNLVIWKDASPGYEHAAPILLQGHLDMVCVKTADCEKDMAAEGLDLATDGEYVWAEKTSLGGDDGIAVAIILAILADDTLPHPPIEAVFTTDEETGMYGAAALDCSDLKARRMLNLDSEEEGYFTVACAGGMRVDCTMPGAADDIEDMSGYAVAIRGLIGGHSGAEIDKGRASANALMGRVLYTVLRKVPGLRLADISGGKFDNVICSSADALVAIPAGSEVTFEAAITEIEATLKNEYAASDPGVTVTCAPASVKVAADQAETAAMLRTLFVLPQGVQEMSMDFPGLVQTSLNLGVMSMEEDGLHFSYSLRSSITSQKELLLQKLTAIITAAGGTVSVCGAYPAWQFVKDSAFRDVVLQAYRDVSGRDGVIVATHGGLECGLFTEKMPGLDVVAMGPNMRDIHSFNERLHVASTERVYHLVCEVLRRCK